MKGRFSSLDIAVTIEELKRFLGMRVVNVYDIDNKTYLIRVGKPDEKSVILLESGIRIHSTEFDWPKNPAPSGFSMKLRKHIKGRRLESITQLGVDRIVDLQFGSSEAAYHVILELYDRGNIVLTDFEYSILNILRTRTDNSQDVKFAVRETYPINSGRQHQIPTEERIHELMSQGKEGDVLKKFLVPNLDYGPALIDHMLLQAGFSENVKFGKGFDLQTDMPKLMVAIGQAEELFMQLIAKQNKGYIVQKQDQKLSSTEGQTEDIVLYDEFHPHLFKQHEKKSFVEFERFDRAVDEFFSKIESQKMDLKVIQQEKNAYKKLSNVKKDHEKRIQGLQKEQETDMVRGELIEMNLDMVDRAILIIRSALANQIDWSEIWNLVKEAQATGDPVAQCIKGLKLSSNEATLLLRDPYEAQAMAEGDETMAIKPLKVDIDLGLSAHGNSRKYFDKKKQAAKKEVKTMEASNKAFKSAEKKTKQSLKEAATAVSINKTRKTYWFEKFLWFISSENYLVIGGRDQQQNELIVKRYLRPGDLYVHADLHGASSCIIKNTGGGPVPPKTLNEAGTMAICNSAAWDSKVVTSAWYVHHDQVSKTAPSGEYLTTGSFMVRGKKNYLPPSYLIYGFGFLFKLEDGSVERHLGERKVRTAEDDALSVADSLDPSTIDEDVELEMSDDSDDEKDVEETSTAFAGEGDEEAEGQDCEAEEVPGLDTKAEVKEEAAEPEFEFPDTSISLTHVKGDKYELQRGVSHDSSSNDQEQTIFLGDGVPVVMGDKVHIKRISAKQRREMKKTKKGTTHAQSSVVSEEKKSEEQSPRLDEEESHHGNSSSDQEQRTKSEKLESKSSKHPVAQALPPKRGQKSKKKKIKEKYADQDEDTRNLMMEILASARPQKEEKKKKGGKSKEIQNQKSQKKPYVPRPVNLAPRVVGEDGVIVGGGELADAMGSVKIDNSEPKTKATEGDSDGEKDDEPLGADDSAALNSLTGLPVAEDELLYAIPVCAPYNAMTNYKYKVKLMPGSTKRGKAAKTALNMFVHEKYASAREKDLLKIQKDTDISRNVPGKVKVAAPNLHRGKK